MHLQVIAHQVKLFVQDLHNPKRMPVPVHVIRKELKWWVRTHSL